MSDFAPRQNFDIDLAIRQAKIATCGLFTKSRLVFAPCSTEPPRAPAASFPDDAKVPHAGAQAGEGEGVS